MAETEDEGRLRVSQLREFKQCYKPCSTILTVFAASVVVIRLGSNPPIALSVIIAVVISNTWLPFLLKGSFLRHWKWATLNSVAMTLLFSLMIGSKFLEFFEVGRGEGSLLGTLLDLVFSALIFLCPWLLTALCGIRCWRADVNAVGRQ